MKKKFYITTPIYYPSAEAHIGHAYCTTLCDVAARYKRMRGCEVYFLTGTDEHGQKIENVAAKAGKTPQQFVDEISEKFKNLWNLMGISNDDFIRTTQERHTEVVQRIFSKFLEKGDIYKGSYSGWYCEPCESFWTETQVGAEKLCPDCGRPVIKAEEECYFFNMQKYVPELLKVYDSNPKFITPVERKNEMLNSFIRPGLGDLCVTRTSFKWGIPVVENPKHVVYVWLDALTNYITALGYGSSDTTKFNKFWNNDDVEIVHCVGADITRFHTIYWPIFLNSLGLRQPDRVIVTGLLMMKDGKMSKSKGNAVSPYPLVERYGVDAVRYYLVREVEFGKDGTFTPEQFVERVNNDLANNFGNLLNRTVSMISKYFDGVIPQFVTGLNAQDVEIDNMILGTIGKYEEALDDMRITEAYIHVMDLLNRGNKYIDETTPWVLAKEGKTSELSSAMVHLAYVLYVSSMLLSPILINKYNGALDQLGVDAKYRNYESLKSPDAVSGNKVSKGEPLFPRLDATIEVEFIKNLMQGK